MPWLVLLLTTTEELVIEPVVLSNTIHWKYWRAGKWVNDSHCMEGSSQSLCCFAMGLHVLHGCERGLLYYHSFILSFLLWLRSGQCLCLWIFVGWQMRELSIHWVISVLFWQLKSYILIKYKINRTWMHTEWLRAPYGISYRCYSPY